MTDGKPADDDAADARRVLAGDLAAFDGIVRRWQGRLVSLAWRFCRDRMMAEDMAQDAFVRAFKALHTYRGEAAFSTWLTSVAMNTYRTAVRERPPVAFDLDPARLRGEGPGALAGLEQRERNDAVRRLVLTLPARYREPMVLYYFEEMNLAETAGALGLREGTLKARLHRGRDLLRRRLTAAGLSDLESAGDD
jgi:RNA polymerase sigma-70 factor (ECF subfamily)